MTPIDYVLTHNPGRSVRLHPKAVHLKDRRGLLQLPITHSCILVTEANIPVTDKNGNEITLSLDASQFDIPFGTYKANQKPLTEWLSDQITKSVVPHLHKLIFTLHPKISPYTPEEYFATIIKAEDGSEIQCTCSSNSVHWSTFFIDNTNERRRAHRLYNEYHRERKKVR